MAYQLKFKANDGKRYRDDNTVVPQLPQELKQWLKKNKFKFEYPEGYDDYYHRIYEYETATSHLRCGVKSYYDGRTEIWLRSPLADEYIEFEKEDLELFYKLGIEFTQTHNEQTGQEMEDWF
jgi:hypothetical protein